ncbi:class I SAM-dependent methyltransferase [Calditrichota bacterium]
MESKHIEEQIEYYRARASEYDEWFLRLGRYYRGEDHKRQWLAEVQKVSDALGSEKPAGNILEIACGTGIWTSQLVVHADRLTAIDASPEMIEVNRAKVADERIEYMVADMFDWQATGQYDFIFFGFWLSHVPKEKFDGFWEMVKSALKPGGKVFFVDSLMTQESTAADHRELDNSGIAERKLNDGRQFNIVKVFYDPAELEHRLNDLGWQGKVATTGEFFLYGMFEQAN